MDNSQKCGVVVFTGSVDRLTRFDEEVARMQRVGGDETHSVLESATFQLVVHQIAGECGVSEAQRVDVRPPAFRELLGSEAAYLRAALLLGLVREGEVAE